MEKSGAATLSLEEINSRAEAFLLDVGAQIQWRAQWEDMRRANNYLRCMPAQQREIALGVACALLDVQNTETNRELVCVQKVADFFQGQMTPEEKSYRKNAIIKFYITACVSVGLSIVCVANELPILAVLALANAGCVMWIGRALRTGSPQWLTDVYFNYS